MPTPAEGPGAIGAAPTDRVAEALAGLVALLYLWHALSLAARAPLWMDEVLSVWTARRPDLPAVWAALRQGSEFTPPLYDSFLHLLIAAGAASPLAWRLPSIVAGLAAAWAVYVFVRRRWDPSLAALAGAMVLAGGLFDYAVQARPYVFVTAAFGWALVLWDDLPKEGPQPKRRVLGLAILLAAMIGLHFYALLLAGLLGLIEVLHRAVERKLPRPLVLAAIGGACLSVLLWWPTLRAAAMFSGQDIFAPDYYGRPTWRGLAAAYALVGGWPAAVAVAMGLTLLIARRGNLPNRKAALVALSLCAIPAIVLAFACLVSHSFAIRYTVAVTFGLAVLIVWAADLFAPHARRFAIGMLVLLMLFPVGRESAEIADPERIAALRLVETAPGAGPIAVGSGLRFLELAANLPPKSARRLVYLDLASAPSGDPTNRHQVQRWKSIDPALPVIEARRFLCRTPRFVLLTDPFGGTDDVPAWLGGRASLAAPPADRPALLPVESKPCRP